MLQHRLIFGTLMVVGAVLLFWADSQVGRILPASTPPGVLLAAVAALLIPLGARELVVMFRARQATATTGLTSLTAIALAGTLYLADANGNEHDLTAVAGSLLLLAVMAALVWHSRRATVHGAMLGAAATVFGGLYLGLPAGFYLAMRSEYGPWVVLAVLATVKSADIGAYFTGRAIGRRKLIPWLSPHKTWEGLVGGVAAAALVAAGLALLSQNIDWASVTRLTLQPDGKDAVLETRIYRFPISSAVIGGIALALVGHLGDLTVSLFKRDANLKDSGHVVPGHGGVLDLMDSPLLAGPVAYWLLQWPASLQAL